MKELTNKEKVALFDKLIKDAKGIIEGKPLIVEMGLKSLNNVDRAQTIYLANAFLDLVNRGIEELEEIKNGKR